VAAIQRDLVSENQQLAIANHVGYAVGIRHAVRIDAFDFLFRGECLTSDHHYRHCNTPNYLLHESLLCVLSLSGLRFLSDPAWRRHVLSV
jgi:hypothetical protein